jgi:hypothetical protein
MTDDMIERVARAIFIAAKENASASWEGHIPEARAAIEAMLPVEVRCPHCESWFKPEDIERDKQ